MRLIGHGTDRLNSHRLLSRTPPQRGGGYRAPSRPAPKRRQTRIYREERPLQPRPRRHSGARPHPASVGDRRQRVGGRQRQRALYHRRNPHGTRRHGHEGPPAKPPRRKYRENRTHHHPSGTLRRRGKRRVHIHHHAQRDPRHTRQRLRLAQPRRQIPPISERKHKPHHAPRGNVARRQHVQLPHG